MEMVAKHYLLPRLFHQSVHLIVCLFSILTRGCGRGFRCSCVFFASMHHEGLIDAHSAPGPPLTPKIEARTCKNEKCTRMTPPKTTSPTLHASMSLASPEVHSISFWENSLRMGGKEYTSAPRLMSIYVDTARPRLHADNLWRDEPSLPPPITSRVEFASSSFP